MSSHLFNLNHRNSSYVFKSVKTKFLDSKATDPKFQTVVLTTVKQLTYVQKFRSLGAIAAEK
jgi:hypothetical protein